MTDSLTPPPAPPAADPSAAGPSAAGPSDGVLPADPLVRELLASLQAARDAVVWKLEGLSELDVRRPLTPTGTNLLGLVKHLAGVEAGYLGEVFGRPFPERLVWAEDDAPANADLWATADEDRAEVVDLYRRVQRHADATAAALPRDAAGVVPWWPAHRRDVTLHRVLVHLVGETHRHAGHADVVRELVDGAAGLRREHGNLPEGDGVDGGWWAEHRAEVQRAAEVAAGAGAGQDG